MALTSGQRSSIVRQHNNGWSAWQIARYSVVPLLEVQAFLDERQARRPAHARPERDAMSRRFSRVTLAYVSFLDGTQLPWNTRRLSLEEALA